MHISIIDDEKILTSKISKKLQLNGYTVSTFYNYRQFMENCIHNELSDLYIIDISLGDNSGFNIIQFLRKKKNSNVPIIIISGFGDTQNKVFGLNLGADDYLTKPFSPDELLARIRAILRRPQTMKSNAPIIYKNIRIDTSSQKVTLEGNIIELTKKEFFMLELFVCNKGKLIEKDKMIQYIWGTQGGIDVNHNTINATVCKLRKKLLDNFPLKTINNTGYILE